MLMVKYAGCETPEDVELARDTINQNNLQRAYTRSRQRVAEAFRAAEAEKSAQALRNLVAQRRKEKKREEALRRRCPAAYVVVNPEAIKIALTKGIFPGHYLFDRFQVWLNGRKPSRRLVREFLTYLKLIGVKVN